MFASAITKQLASAVSNGISASQSLSAAGALLLNGSLVHSGIALLVSGRQVVIHSDGDDSGLTWTVIGTRDDGSVIKDVFAGANGDAASNLLDFFTVTSISGSAASASTVHAGTNGVGASVAKIFGDTINTPNISFDCEILSGSVNYSIQYTQEPFLAPISPNGSSPAIAFAPATPNPTWHDFTNPNLSALSASAQGAPTFVFHAWRLLINSGTGQIRVTGRQAGLASP